MYISVASLLKPSSTMYVIKNKKVVKEEKAMMDSYDDKFEGIYKETICIHLVSR
jgi:hypothetical protein